MPIKKISQKEYAAILFDDCGFTGQQRRDFLAAKFAGRKYSDELNGKEMNWLIDHLKWRKEQGIKSPSSGDAVA